jgi:DNA (cytosine-5)-methyltransferase 1
LEGLAGNGDGGNESGWLDQVSSRPASTAGIARYWDAYDIVACRDGKARRIEPGSFPLAHGISGRVGLLRGYGNAINPYLAAEFVAAYLEAKREGVK